MLRKEEDYQLLKQLVGPRSAELISSASSWQHATGMLGLTGVPAVIWYGFGGPKLLAIVIIPCIIVVVGILGTISVLRYRAAAREANGYVGQRLGYTVYLKDGGIYPNRWQESIERAKHVHESSRSG